MAMYVYGKRIRPERLAVLVVAAVVFTVYLYVYSLPNILPEVVDDKKSSVVSLPRRQGIDNIDQQFLEYMDSKVTKCPDYTKYSELSHEPFSKGPLKYAYMRPAPKCRTFVSSAVEYVIDDLKKKLKDEDLGRLVENCLPNTLDTAILWHVPTGEKNTAKQVPTPQTFIVTGDIHAEWLRDSARQMSAYQPFVKYDTKLQELIKGAINTQSLYLWNSPYCNAFHPPTGSGIKKGNSAIDKVHPRPDWRHVFECKYELDSLASFLTLSNEYYANSGDMSFVNDAWLQAYNQILSVLRRESSPTFNQRTGSVLPFYYTFQRDTNIGTETLPLAGTGNPVNYGTGLIRSAFRPSDDACILQFFIPANMHMLTELKTLRTQILNEKLHVDSKLDINAMIATTDTVIKNVEIGINQHGIVDHPIFGKVYAYEVDGYGSSIFMDDANIPSLLAAPDMGYIELENKVYQNTRKMLLSKNGNPYYLKGRYFSGIGGPHIGINNAWPMSLLVAMRTTNDDEEILRDLKLVMESTAGLGLIHESVQVNSRGGNAYTRSWFAWGNSEFGKTILHLAKHKPHLIFKEEYHQPYDIDKVLQEFQAQQK
ncbi:hypothetical protein PSN45_001545 [Yamadazyma tenuis]|uniref:DUF1237-domain-containing protein n=1 Tax=Candida tenuis (strain ATCC 10573 / BCRC 21748 / CBS 615 / JCM 9827 / NBRC 10315 / NRRL Y-1498 / VKM Y-70) TaxID=590646 RepID=G3BFF9_CANTC|nr:uncharacterized protein CANTEDRAFT_96126 [Yamadazyma tenuis ATCC 10573]EGV60682.1 hypothetical protein CANTEDRAFT_96126 [Yamadazyma tenuis ATCC 10573]WEJ94066.1 hypothetical protein PSN45_001545 [Yamadazyma tenuis]